MADSRDPAVLETPLADREPASKPASTPTTPPKEAPAAEPEYEGGRDISKVIDAAAKKARASEEPKPATPAPVTTQDQQKAVARAWKLYTKEGQEVKDFDLNTMTAAEFLAHKFGYNALGKEQQRDWDGVLRNAQLGHYNADKVLRIEQEREHAVRSYRAEHERATAYEDDRKIINQALLAATRQNYEPLRQLVAEFQKAYEAGEQEPAPVPEGYVSEAELKQQQDADRVYNEVVLPNAKAIGEKFGYPTQQVAKAIMGLVERYPDEYFDMSVLQNIINVELPEYLTRLREEHPPEPSAEAKKIAELEKKVSELSGSKIEEENAAVQAAHNRRKVAPPGVPTVAAGAGDDATPEFKSVAEARAWAKSYKG